jgi:ParB family chromosome partitioning protein
VKHKALGRGLSALIPNTTEIKKSAGDNFFLCPIEKIIPNKGQPRRHFNDTHLEELAASIREQGIVQPLVVRPEKEGNYLLIAGERRWRAAQKAGAHEVPVIIRDINDLQAFELALVENLQREDLNPVEEAEAYRHLIEEHHYTQEQLAQRLGRDRSTITNSLRLLKLPEAAQQALAGGELSAGHARALLGLDDVNQILQILKQIVSRQLSVRQTEVLVKRMRQPKVVKDSPSLSPNVKALQERLSHALNTQVRLITKQKDNGLIEIKYNSLDQLDSLLEVLLK